MNHLPATALSVMLMLGLPAAVFGAPSVEDIVHQANCAAYYQGQDGRARVSMRITDANGRERQRELIVLRRDQGADAGPNSCRSQKYYVYLRRPADLNKTVFMAWKRPGGEDSRWLYLPALDVVKRIAAGDKRTSFVGSDFFYEDITGRDIAADRHTLERTSDQYYVLKSKPRAGERVEFEDYRVWIHRQSFIPVKVEYYRSGDHRYRVYEAQAVEAIQGYPTVVRSRIRDLDKGSETVLRFQDIEYDIGLPEDLFSERYLRQAPTRYLR